MLYSPFLHTKIIIIKYKTKILANSFRNSSGKNDGSTTNLMENVNFEA